MTRSRVAIVGAGPAGLMAAERLAADHDVDVYDAMPSVGRKFLLAGKGGMNLTHAEPFDAFVARYGARAPALRPALEAFGPRALREWAAGLGIDTFVGSSDRVFPVDMKAAPLLRAWLHRLRAAGVRLHMRHRWTGFAADGRGLRFDMPEGAITAEADAVVLALGGASWPRLGSDGAWVPILAERGVDLAPLRPANCGFEVEGGWSELLRTRHAGAPLKNIAIEGRRGECVLTETGLEGNLVYALGAAWRDTLDREGRVVIHLDLLPAFDAAKVQAEVARPRGSRSFSTHLKSRLGLDGAKLALLHERLPREAMQDPGRVAAAIKALPIAFDATRPIAEAISTAGGVRFEALDDTGMLKNVPHVTCAGEMLDWEAPTGGYLLTACFASGVAAAEAAGRFLQRSP